MPKPPCNLREFSALLMVVESLRGPDGCPWDKEQTHSTLTRYAIEEVFEFAEAIDSGKTLEIREELGDLLFQVVLHAEIARQEGAFNIHDVIGGLNEKMIRRHPHVFGDTRVSGPSEVLKNWAEIKAAEKAAKAVPSVPSAFNIPVNMPALLRSQKIGEKTAKLNFDWSDAAACWPKIREEIDELDEAMSAPDMEEAVATASAGGPTSNIEAELGDVLFSLAQLARHLGLDAEQCLRKANSRFISRFDRMQERVHADAKKWESLPADEKERRWKQAKSPSS